MGSQVKARIKPRIWFYPSLPANGQIVEQSIFGAARLIGELFEIKGCVEKRMRRTTFVGAYHHVMEEWVETRVGNIGVFGQIPGGGKKRMRIATFEPSIPEVMDKWVDVLRR